MSQIRFWNLFAKKLAGEALPEELKELEQLMRDNPDWLYPAEHIQQLWQHPKETDSYESELAFEIHLNKLKGSGIKLPDLETPAGISEFQGTIRPIKKKKFLFFSLVPLAILIS